MSSQSPYTDFEVLTSELGALIAAADAVRLPPGAVLAIEDAIDEAAMAVAQAVVDETDTLIRARAAIDTAAQVIAALDEMTARRHQLRAKASRLSERAKELVERARGLA
jgi:hypothetical protein